LGLGARNIGVGSKEYWDWGQGILGLGARLLGFGTRNIGVGDKEYCGWGQDEALHFQ